MAKRIVTRVGNVFCTEIDNQYKCYFQYIANDKSQLNGSTIRVFKTHYPMDNVADLDAIVNDEVSFYAHAMLKVGIEMGAWYKVGNHKDVGDVKSVGFKLFSYEWYVWNISCPYVFVHKLNDEQKRYDWGPVYPYFAIIEKIRTGTNSFDINDQAKVDEIVRREVEIEVRNKSDKLLYINIDYSIWPRDITAEDFKSCSRKVLPDTFIYHPSYRYNLEKYGFNLTVVTVDVLDKTKEGETFDKLWYFREISYNELKSNNFVITIDNDNLHLYDRKDEVLQAQREHIRKYPEMAKYFPHAVENDVLNITI